MVVLSVALVTRTGRALLARQFVEASRIRVEGLLAAFPKLLSDAASGSKQHTYVETDTVRYVYTPLESSLYLVLITNRGSNIVEDLDTLRLLSKVIPEQMAGLALTEEGVAARAFELIFAFDEVVAAGGFREDVSLHQIRVHLEMESHEEKLAQMIKASKMAQAKEAAKKQAALIRERTREQERAERMAGGGGGAGRLGGISGGPGYDRGDMGHGGHGGGYGSAGSSGSGSAMLSPSDEARNTKPLPPAASSSAAAAAAPRAGMVLGAKKGGMALGGSGSGGAGGGAGAGGRGLGGGAGLAGVMAEEGMRGGDLLDDAHAAAAAAGAGGSAAAASAATAAAAAAVAAQATITAEERLTAKLSRDGTVEALEIKGTLTLSVADEAAARLRVLVSGVEESAAGGFQFQTHPHINKGAFTGEGVITLRAPEKPFPVATPLGLVRWTKKLKDAEASAAPLSLTCWPEAGAGGVITVNLEFNLEDTSLTLHDVVITVPLGTDAAPRVSSCSGDWKHNTREHVLTWHVESIDADNSTGSLEFAIKSRNEDGFFPVSLSFSAGETLCPLAVRDVASLDDGRSLRFASSRSLAVESYSVE